MSADVGFVTDRLVARSWSIADAAAFNDSELELFRLRRAEVPDGSLDAG